MVEIQFVSYMSCFGMKIMCHEKVFWQLVVLTMAAKTTFFLCSLVVYGLEKHDRDRNKEWNGAEGKGIKQITGYCRTRQNCR